MEIISPFKTRFFLCNTQLKSYIIKSKSASLEDKFFVTSALIHCNKIAMLASLHAT